MCAIAQAHKIFKKWKLNLFIYKLKKKEDQKVQDPQTENMPLGCHKPQNWGRYWAAGGDGDFLLDLVLLCLLISPIAGN